MRNHFSKRVQTFITSAVAAGLITGCDVRNDRVNQRDDFSPDVGGAGRPPADVRQDQGALGAPRQERAIGTAQANGPGAGADAEAGREWVETLAPGELVEWRVQARATDPNRVKFQVDLRSEATRDVVSAAEPTTLY
jgi:hypothetical protein